MTRKKGDHYFLFILVVIVLFGFAILASASTVLSYEAYGNSYGYLKHQVLYGFLPGLLLFLISGITMYALTIYLGLDKKFAFISALLYILNGHISKIISWGWLTTFGGYAILPLAFLFGIIWW